MTEREESVFTRSAMHGDIDDVEDITEVVHEVPEIRAEVLQLPEDAAADDDDHIVKDGQRDDCQPTVVELSGGIEDQGPEESADRTSVAFSRPIKTQIHELLSVQKLLVFKYLHTLTAILEITRSC
ncbi:hypothetical protein AVEN_33196-1 [Araneus ventricosus]|uniref:Uncharacterized protein n=1 Tax=Araneus ventricosus TaxID=182803 RepID=A0A4Y2RHC5_ARAVE|nr:hypothetical protein AVEN_33196-1 [Araneus ventricosus]